MGRADRRPARDGRRVLGGFQGGAHPAPPLAHDARHGPENPARGPGALEAVDFCSGHPGVITSGTRARSTTLRLPSTGSDSRGCAHVRARVVTLRHRVRFVDGPALSVPGVDRPVGVAVGDVSALTGRSVTAPEGRRAATPFQSRARLRGHSAVNRAVGGSGA